ncbi:MAG TPA: GntR family transcriptional regulator [Nocardioidaceae bacterium]|nr:GntR family transcriptional regulator [Nocardioidaceae bacterium]
MALEKIARRSLTDEVYEQILGELVDGSLSPGQALPSERRLAEVLGVSRPAVREALQRMAHAGLVEVRQGGSTTVIDFRRLGGLDLLPHLLLPGGQVDLKVARSIMEARLTVGPKAAELAAARASKDAVEAIRNAVRAIELDDDPIGRQRRALLFWELVVEAADSIAFRLMFNSLRAAYEPALDVLAVVMSAEVDRLEAYDGLADAIEAGDTDLARQRADDLLGYATRSLLQALDQIQGEDA